MSPPPSGQHVHHRGAWVGVVTVTLTLVGWSSVPLFLKHFSHSIDAWTSNGWRYGFSALLWLPVVIAAILRRGRGGALWRAAVIPGLINALAQVAFTWAHYKIEPGLLTFGLRTQILFVAVGAYLMFPSERAVIRTRTFWAGIVSLGAGTAGMILFGENAPSPTRIGGITLAILAGAGFAAYGLSVRRFMSGFHPVAAFAVISQYTAAIMVALMLLMGDRGRALEWPGGGALDLSGGQFVLLLFSAVVGIALGHVFYYISIARLGVAVSSGIIQLQPFGVAVASYFLFGERLSAIQWMCGLVAVGGAMLMLYAQRTIARRGRAARAAAAQAEDDDASSDRCRRPVRAPNSGMITASKP